MATASTIYKAQDATLANGTRLRYYEWENSGPELILLHGSSGYALMYEETARLLSSRFHIYIPDQRGHGDSDRPDGNYSAEEFAEDAHLFLQAMGLTSAIIGGHSMGGRAAQIWAARYPSECRAMILIGGPHLSNFFLTRENAVHVIEAVERMFATPPEFASREEAMDYLRGVRAGRDTDATLEHRIDHNMNNNGGRYSFKYDPVRVAQGLTHMTDDLRGYAPQVQCPVAILRSSQGGELTPELAADVAGYWKDATVYDVDGGYLMHVVAPAATAVAIKQFVDAKVLR